MTHTGTAQPRGLQTAGKSLWFMATTSKSSLMLQTSYLCPAVQLGSTHSTNPGEEHLASTSSDRGAIGSTAATF